MQKIFEEVAREWVGIESEATAELEIEKTRKCMAWVDSKSNKINRSELCSVIAHAAFAIAKIDAEAESAQFREQARTLLVAAQALGMGSMGVTEGGIAFYFREETGLRYDACDGAADALANCVLQARKAKP